MSWTPTNFTQPTAEWPLRVAEFDELFATWCAVGWSRAEAEVCGVRCSEWTATLRMPAYP